MPVFDLTSDAGVVIEQTADYSATDDATPLSVDDTSASTGDLTVSFDDRGRPAAWKRLKGQKVTVQVTGRDPRPLGTVQHVSGGDAGVSLAIDTVLNRLAVTRKAEPYTGTIGGVLGYWAGLCGLDDDDVTVAASIAQAKVSCVGFYDSVWLRIKQFSAALGFEVVSVDNVLVARPPRPVTITIDDDLLVSTQWDVDDTTMTRYLEVVYYEPSQILPGDQTADYSRSTVPQADADDPIALRTSKGHAINKQPPGWTGVVPDVIST